jgi:hypothetical protein
MNSIGRNRRLYEGIQKLVCGVYKTPLGKEDLPATGAEGAFILLSDDEGAPEMERPV